jgi:hypothetical protein
MLKNNCKDYSQWFPGNKNDLADSLSQDFHLSNADLLSLFHSKIPKQTPKNLKILPLPLKITLFLSSMLQSLPENSQTLKAHKISSLALGFIGKNSSNKTLSSTNSQNNNNQPSSQPLPNQSEIDNIRNHLITPFSTGPSVPLWTMWHRPSENSTEAIPEWTKTGDLAAFYNCRTKAIKQQTCLKRNKKPYLSESSESCLITPLKRTKPLQTS